MTTSTNFSIPDMTLNLERFRMAIQDYDYIEKHNNQAAALEEWSQRLMQFATTIEHYLGVASQLPESIRNVLQSIVDEAKAAETAIRYQISSVRLPELTEANRSMLMRVSADGSQYEVVSPEQIFSSFLQSLEDSGRLVTSFDTGWFLLNKGSLTTKEHTLGRMPHSCQIYIKDGFGNVTAGGDTVTHGTNAYGTGIRAVTDSYVTIRAASNGIYLAPNMSGLVESGYAKVVLT